MEDNSQIVKALENVSDATDTELRLTEDSLNASTSGFTQTELLSESIEDFDIKSLFVTRCDNCHAEECRGMFDKCLILRIILIIVLIALTCILNIWNF